MGDLEVKSVLLAASLRRFVECDYEMVAAIPVATPFCGRPGAHTLATLFSLGVRFVDIKNPLAPDYLIGHKLACLAIPTQASKIVFLDSDMLCMRAFDWCERFNAAQLSAKPADLSTFAESNEAWMRVYQQCNLSMPDAKIRATVSRRLMAPYFNAGFIAATDGKLFSDAWISYALRIDADPEINNKRPWLDQIALPVAAHSLKIQVDCLDEGFNYPAHLKLLDPDRPPYFCHYHNADIILREPALRSLITALKTQFSEVKRFTANAVGSHQFVRQLIMAKTSAHPRTTPEKIGSTGTSRPATEPLHTPDLIITGVPRSGTSYLCALLSKLHETVVINEPAEIFPFLVTPDTPFGLPLYYSNLRRDILCKRPIANKIREGRMIEDTFPFDERTFFTAYVDRQDFLLATKNTLAYIARLPYLVDYFPNAKIVACIRNPYDAIASWKSSFAHLANADMQLQSLGNAADTYLSPAQRLALTEIAQAPTVVQRRALMWCYLAECLLTHQKSLLILKYESMVTNPLGAVQKIFDHAEMPFPPQLREPVSPSQVRSKSQVLSAADRAAINGICGDTAAKFGYASHCK